MKCLVWLVAAHWLLGPTAPAEDQPVPVSLIQLIATPEKFDRKLISVVGYLAVGRERRALLFLHREDADHMLVSNSIAVVPSEAMIGHTEELNRMYVNIVGVFRAVPAANGGLATVIKDIRQCHTWSDPARPLIEYPYGKRRAPPIDK